MRYHISWVCPNGKTGWADAFTKDEMEQLCFGLEMQGYVVAVEVIVG